MAFALAVLFACAAPAYGFAPNLSFNQTFSVIHPFLGWQPRSNLTLWNMTFSDTPWSSYVPGMVGQGDSAMSMANATEASQAASQPVGLTFTFVGTAMAVHGTLQGQNWDPSKIWPNKPMDFSIDDKTVNVDGPSGTDIVRADGLPMAPHEIQVHVNQGFVSISGVSLTMAIKSQAPTFEDVETSTQRWIVNGTRNDFFLYKGNWTVSTHIGGVGGQEPIEYPTLFQTIDDGPPKQTFFNIPRNTSMVMINGTVGPTYTSLLEFSLSPPAPGKESHEIYDKIGMNNAWTAPDAILYLAALDPTIEYSFTISRSLIDTWNASNPNDVGLHSVTFYNALSNIQPPSQDAAPIVTPAKGMSRGQIAGAVVGALVGAALIAAVAFFVAGKLLRRRQQKLRHGDPSTFVVDDGDEVAPIPYNGGGSDPSSPIMEERKGAPTPVAVPSPRPTPRPRRVQQEFDAGAADDDVDYIPPQYDPQWSRPHNEPGPSSSNTPHLPSPPGGAYAQLKTELLSPITPPTRSPTDPPSEGDAYVQLKSDLLSPTSPAAPSPFAANNPAVPGGNVHAQLGSDLLSPAGDRGYSQSQLHSAALLER